MDQKELETELRRLSAHVMALEHILTNVLDVAARSGVIPLQTIKAGFALALTLGEHTAAKMPSNNTVDVHLSRVRDTILKIKAAHFPD